MDNIIFQNDKVIISYEHIHGYKAISLPRRNVNPDFPALPLPNPFLPLNMLRFLEIPINALNSVPETCNEINVHFTTNEGCDAFLKEFEAVEG